MSLQRQWPPRQRGLVECTMGLHCHCPSRQRSFVDQAAFHRNHSKPRQANAGSEYIGEGRKPERFEPASIEALKTLAEVCGQSIVAAAFGKHGCCVHILEFDAPILRGNFKRKKAWTRSMRRRSVAQFGSAPALGAGGRWFESSRSDSRDECPEELHDSDSAGSSPARLSNKVMV